MPTGPAEHADSSWALSDHNTVGDRRKLSTGPQVRVTWSGINNSHNEGTSKIICLPYHDLVTYELPGCVTRAVVVT